MKMRAYLIDDERLALGRLRRLLEETGRVEIAGWASDPEEALAALSSQPVDVLFLDIQMPGMTGFELLGRLAEQPLVVFTTAYNQYALEAFEVNSIDYLLKPIERARLDRALGKLERVRGGQEPRPDLPALVQQLASALAARQARYPDRLASRLGDKTQFVELSRVTHIFAQDKLTYAATAHQEYCLDATIAELEQKLDPETFVRIHRSTIVNIAHVEELHAWFAGGMRLRLKDEKRTELTVARDRVKHLKHRLGVLA
jgi:two-component system, LytTR family, response regulator